MNQTIRQQSAIRSPLVRTAESGLNTPRKPKRRAHPLPLSFLIDGTACTDDALTACYPRTARQAFGHYAADRAPARITFLQRPRGGLLGLLVAAAVLAFFVITGAPK